MKKLLLLILIMILASLVFAQSQKKIEKETLFFKTFLKTGYPKQQVTCGEKYVGLFMGRKKLILQSDDANLDLTLIKKGTQWRGVDAKGNKYTIYGIQKGETVGMLIVPDDVMILGVLLINQNVCE